MNRALSEGAIYLMHHLMTNETVANKVKNANGGEEGKQYSIYSIKSNGSVVLGETKYRFWNRLIGCELELPFEKWALVVWDALVDLSKNSNAVAIEEGLSKEIAKEAQRNGNYEWVVKRLYDCYEHVCNNKGGASSAGDRDNHGSSASKTIYVNGEPVVVNVMAEGVKRVLKFPDATGRKSLRFELGVTGVRVEDEY